VLGSLLPDSENLEEAFYQAHQFNASVFDPFMGSGTTVGEAAKLGCLSIGRDINPVSHIMVDAALQSYSEKDVRETFHNLEQTAGKRIRYFYSRSLESGETAEVLYYFWVKVVPCPSCDYEQQLFKSRVFSKHAYSKKYPMAHSLCPQCNAINKVKYHDEQAICQNCRETYNPHQGNVTRAGVRCGSCGALFNLIDAVRLLDGPPRHKMYAKMLLYPNGRKSYLPIDAVDEVSYRHAEETLKGLWHHIPNEHLEMGFNTRQVLNYNYSQWHQMFNARQLVSLALLVSEIKKIEQPQLKKLFACLLSGTLEFNNMFASFKGEGTGAVRHMFAHHILRPELTPLEANVWGTPKSSGSFSTLFRSRILRALEYKKNPFELRFTPSRQGRKVFHINKPLNKKIVHKFKDLAGNEAVYLSLGDSAQTDMPDESIDFVITDPPFFDNVHYSELADFFHVWLKKTLGSAYATMCPSTRSDKEVQNGDAKEFSKRLSTILLECRRLLRPNGLLVFTYHHSRFEGWTALYVAVREAGFSINQVHPVRSEMSVSVPIQQSKTPINYDLIFVCRKHNYKTPNPLGKKEMIRIVLEKTHDAVDTLRSAKMKVSLGDIRAIQMGYLLTQLSEMNEISKELQFISGLQQDLDQLAIEQAALSEEKQAFAHKGPPAQLHMFPSR